jgi:CheY-like chemotaxis protein
MKVSANQGGRDLLPSQTVCDAEPRRVSHLRTTPNASGSVGIFSLIVIQSYCLVTLRGKPKCDCTFPRGGASFRWSGGFRRRLARQEGPSLSTLSVISVVDDDPSIRAALNNLLSSRGHVVHTFGSAEQFLGAPQLNDTSCVISDLQMPAMDGLELLANMRRRGYATPFIFITAFPDESVRARALVAGATCFLAKPFAVSMLIACLDAALEPQRSGLAV